MQNFSLGQRWISDSEPELGLGLVIEIEHRMVSIEFPDTDQTRMYAKANAPLSRIVFNIGDEVHDRDNNAYEVVSIDNVDGLLVYHVKLAEGDETQPLPETALSDAISLNQPLIRLLAGQADHSHWFQLRASALESLNFVEKSNLLGLCSARTELIPHQLYIANEVAQRYAPRVLLADEVGLGKTIEACLIMQQQLFSGLASRVLIVVPETLLHQWLVELLRRFNLNFSIFDVERCLAIADDKGINPFETEQLILCSSELFIHSPELHAQALAAQWDLLIVDEAHHLKPSTDEALQKSSENIAYDNINSLSAKVKGLILLTATPDQLGQKSHFSLLRLLDPNRFHNFDEFLEEQTGFVELASLIEQLESINQDSTQNTINSLSKELTTIFEEQDLLDDSIKTLLTSLDSTENRTALINTLVDRHGTGRILFRNTRKLISGFAQRQLHPYPLINPDLYSNHITELTPEKHYIDNPKWIKEDPRVQFVCDLLQKHKKEKILLICAKKETASNLEEYLRLRQGIRSSIFHEDMTILERDRAAAYFSDFTTGAQILLCSEIGSEGRNFQFSHHLVLFDLPLNPDLLEQRIGRLDRIGQKNTINIHVPYLQETAQEKLFHWYHEGLNAFQNTNPAASKVFQQQETDINDILCDDTFQSMQSMLALIKQTKILNQGFLEEFSKGRDRLLEINSFNERKTKTLINQIDQLEASNSPKPFLTQVFDNFGIESEENSDSSWVIQPGEDMVVSSFPVIPDQGLTFTYDREDALHREDIQFLNWHHPLVEQSIDLILQSDPGKSAIAILQDKRFDSGSILLESLYRVEIKAAKELQAKRFLPATTMRVLVDNQKRHLSDIISAEHLNQKLQHIDKSHVMSLLNDSKTTISEISHLSEQLLSKQLPKIIKQCSELMLASLSAEIKRLVALQQVNPNIRSEEIDFLKNQTLSLHKAFAGATLQLEAVRLIFIA